MNEDVIKLLGDGGTEFTNRVLEVNGVATFTRAMRNEQTRVDCRGKHCLRSRPGRTRRPRGVKFGRKPTLTPHQQKEARKRLDAGENAAQRWRAATT